MKSLCSVCCSLLIALPVFADPGDRGTDGVAQRIPFSNAERGTQSVDAPAQRRTAKPKPKPKPVKPWGKPVEVGKKLVKPGEPKPKPTSSTTAQAEPKPSGGGSDDALTLEERVLTREFKTIYQGAEEMVEFLLNSKGDHFPIALRRAADTLDGTPDLLHEFLGDRAGGPGLTVAELTDIASTLDAHLDAALAHEDPRAYLRTWRTMLAEPAEVSRSVDYVIATRAGAGEEGVGPR